MIRIVVLASVLASTIGAVPAIAQPATTGADMGTGRPSVTSGTQNSGPPSGTTPGTSSSTASRLSGPADGANDIHSDPANVSLGRKLLGIPTDTASPGPAR